MADKRKLQSDIERNLKRVTEGRTAFQEILVKFESSTNATQKEKFEGDLKKEIKKLQRLRDQIKTWLTASEVKDKRALFDARKEIEQDMERFKIIEKETKTKAYSKEGLLSTEAKKDPQQKEKEELDDWLKQCISSLNTQSEKYEFEIERLSNSTKKKRIDKETAALIEEKRQRLEVCSFHVKKLESIMRLLDNERLDCKNVRFIQESIEYVIDCGADQSIDFKNIYDDLCLDELGDSSGLTAASGNLVTNQDHDLNTVIAVSTDITNQRNGSDDAASSTSTHTSISNNTDSSVTHPSSSASSNASSSRERAKSDEKVSLLPHVSSSSTPVKFLHPTSSSSKHKNSNLANQTAPPALMSQVVSGTPNKSTGKTIINHPTTPNGSNNSVTNDTSVARTGVCNFDNQTPVETSTRNQKLDVYQKPSDRSNTISSNSQSLPKCTVSGEELRSSSPVSLFTAISTTLPLSSVPAVQTSRVETVITANRDEEMASNQFSVSNFIQPSSPTSNNKLPDTTKVSDELSSVYVNPTLSNTTTTDAVEISKHTPPSLLSAAMLAASQDKQLSSLLASSQHTSTLMRVNPSLGSGVTLDPSNALSLSAKFQSNVTGTLSLSPSIITPANPQAQSPYVTLENQVSNLQSSIHSQQPKTLHNSPVHAHIHPRDAAAPFRNRNLDKPKGYVPPELVSQLQALESGHRRLPNTCDTEKSRMIVCKNTASCPNYYPREPIPGTDSEEYYMKLDAQTLFFIFYYFEGTKAQYYAAKALKRMSWRFHTKFMMWFQRHEEPKQITDEYESGSYIYYDFRTMRQRKKEEFMFHYSFLEDKDF